MKKKRFEKTKALIGQLHLLALDCAEDLERLLTLELKENEDFLNELDLVKERATALETFLSSAVRTAKNEDLKAKILGCKWIGNLPLN